MKIRFFNTYEPVVPLYRELFPYLAAKGHLIEAVVAKAKYRSGEQHITSKGVNFKEVPVASFPFNNSQLDKVATHASYAVTASLSALFNTHYDLNIFLTQPPMFNSLGTILKYLRKQRYICLVMDLYPHVAMEAGILSKNSKVAKLLQYQTANTMRSADAVIVIGRCMKRRILEMGVDENRIHVIPNWANTEFIQPLSPSQNSLRDKYNLQGKFVVMYSGNMGISHQFDTILSVAKKLESENMHDIVFIFSGSGTRRKEIEKYISNNGSENVLLTGFHPYDQLKESLGIGDVHFVSLRKGFEGLVVPSKTYGAMSAGRPIIYEGDIKGEIAQSLVENDFGLVVENSQPDKLYNAVVSLYKNKNDTSVVLGKRARSCAARLYSTDNMLRSYTKLIESFDNVKN